MKKVQAIIINYTQMFTNCKANKDKRFNILKFNFPLMLQQLSCGTYTKWLRKNRYVL